MRFLIQDYKIFLALMNENEQRIEKLKKIKVGDELFYSTEKNGNLSEDVYSQCLDETIKELKKEDPEAGINNAIVSYCIDSTSEQYKNKSISYIKKSPDR